MVCNVINRQVTIEFLYDAEKISQKTIKRLADMMIETFNEMEKVYLNNSDVLLTKSDIAGEDVGEEEFDEIKDMDFGE